MSDTNLAGKYYNCAIKKTMYDKISRVSLVRTSEKIFALNWSHFLQDVSRNAALDIGFGPGLFLEVYQKLGFAKIVGVDRSPDCVDNAAKLIENKKNITLICADINEYLKNSVGEKYDIISAFHVIEHMDSRGLNNFLTLCKNRLTDSGILILETPNMQYPLANYHRWGDTTHLTGFTPDALETLLEYTGFSKIFIGEKRVPFTSLFHRVRNIPAQAILHFFYPLLILILEGYPELKSRRKIFTPYFYTVAKL